MANWWEDWWAWLTGAGSGDTGGHVGPSPATARPDAYRSVDQMAGTAHDPNDVVLARTTDFSQWSDPQMIWRVALKGLDAKVASVKDAGKPWKNLHALMTGHRADGDPSPPPPANLSNDLKKLVDAVVGDASAWVGAAPAKFREAIAQVVTFVVDLDGRASAPPGTTSMATVSDALVSHMTTVFERLRDSKFTNGGVSWQHTSTADPKTFYTLDPPGSGWAQWAAQQRLSIQIHSAHTTINGRQWEQAAATGDAELHYPGAQAKAFGQQLTKAKVTWLTASQQALFGAAGNHLKDLYAAMYSYVPVVPKRTRRPGEGEPATTSSPGPAPMAAMPSFDAGAGLPSPDSVLGPGLAPGTGDGNPFGAVVDGLPSAVIGSGADIATTAAEFAPPAFGAMTDGLGALTPGSVAGAFGPGLSGLDGAPVVGGVGGTASGRLGALPVGLVGSPAVDGAGRPTVVGGPGVGAVRGLGAGAEGPGAGVPGGLVGGPRAGGPMMPPMLPPARSGQQDEGSEHDLIEDCLFQIDPEGTEAVVGHRETGPSHRPGATQTRRVQI